MKIKSQSIPTELIRLKANKIWQDRLHQGISGTPESDWMAAKEYLETHWWKVLLWRWEKLISKFWKSIRKKFTVSGNRT